MSNTIIEDKSCSRTWLLESENFTRSRQYKIRIIVTTEIERTAYGVELIAREALRKCHFRQVEDSKSVRSVETSSKVEDVL